MPRIDEVSPASGPLGGGTLVRISGSNYEGGSDYRCRFGGSTSDANLPNGTDKASYDAASGSVRCFAPPSSGPGDTVVNSSLWISLNAQQYHAVSLGFG